jgi:hypothetical protein
VAGNWQAARANAAGGNQSAVQELAGEDHVGRIEGLTRRTEERERETVVECAACGLAQRIAEVRERVVVGKEA